VVGCVFALAGVLQRRRPDVRDVAVFRAGGYIRGAAWRFAATRQRFCVGFIYSKLGGALFPRAMDNFFEKSRAEANNDWRVGGGSVVFAVVAGGSETDAIRKKRLLDFSIIRGARHRCDLRAERGNGQQREHADYHRGDCLQFIGYRHSDGGQASGVGAACVCFCAADCCRDYLAIISPDYHRAPTGADWGIAIFDYVAGVWRGLVAPAGRPDDVGIGFGCPGDVGKYVLVPTKTVPSWARLNLSGVCYHMLPSSIVVARVYAPDCQNFGWGNVGSLEQSLTQDTVDAMGMDIRPFDDLPSGDVYLFFSDAPYTTDKEREFVAEVLEKYPSTLLDNHDDFGIVQSDVYRIER